MENKIGFTDAFSAVKGVVVALFGKQKDNQMLKDLDIKKGVVAGFGYLIYIFFVLPLKILAFILKPTWAWVHFVQRHLVSPFFEIEALTGSESPSRLLGEIYEKNLNYFKNTADSGVNSSTLKPSISILERIMIFAKVRIVVTLLFFALAAYFIYETLSSIFATISVLIGFTSGVSSFGFMKNGLDTSTLVGGITTGALIGYIVWILAGALISYLLIFAFRFITQSFKSIMYADRDMIRDFVDDSLHYTISKSIELYGEDTALKAYDLLLENVVTNLERYTTDEPHYKRLGLKQDKEMIALNNKD